MARRIIATLFCTWAGTAYAAVNDVNSPQFKQLDEHFAIIAQSSNHFGGYERNTMDVDIKPGDANNIVRARSGRIIPIAIFGSSDLDVTTINPRTIRLNGVDVMLVGKSDKSLCSQTDINDDSYQDLVCDVRTTGFRVDEGEYQIILKAATYNGESLTGEDRIRIVRN